MGRSRTSRLKEPAFLSERWESTLEREPLSFSVPRATGATCVNSTHAMRDTRWLWLTGGKEEMDECERVSTRWMKQGKEAAFGRILISVRTQRQNAECAIITFHKDFWHFYSVSAPCGQRVEVHTCACVKINIGITVWHHHKRYTVSGRPNMKSVVDNIQHIKKT